LKKKDPVLGKSKFGHSGDRKWSTRGVEGFSQNKNWRLHNKKKKSNPMVRETIGNLGKRMIYGGDSQGKQIPDTDRRTNFEKKMNGNHQQRKGDL